MKWVKINMEKKVAEIVKLLKAKGYNITHSRNIMIRLFVETEKHLKPEEVYDLAKDQGISLPTVYRNIDVLKKTGVIKEITINNDRFYELHIYSQKKLHIHFRCNRCGNIRDYNNRNIFKKMIQQKDYIEETFGDHVEDISIVMRGICRDCHETG